MPIPCNLYKKIRTFGENNTISLLWSLRNFWPQTTILAITAGTPDTPHSPKSML